MDNVQLIAEYYSKVKRIASGMSKHMPVHFQLADIVQSGIVGLLDANSKFNSDKHASFKTYADFRIVGSILDNIRSWKKVPFKGPSLQEKSEQIYVNTEINKQFRFAIDQLSDQERQIILMYYYEDASMKDIGKKLHMTESNVSLIHKRAIKRLQELFNG